MTLEQYWIILIKRWQIILICFLVVGLGTFIGSKLMKPFYQSSVLVQVVIRSSSTNQADYNNLQASDQLVQTEADLAMSDTVLREVASHHPGLTVSQLAGEVSSTTKLNTQLFEIDVVDQSPTQAANLNKGNQGQIALLQVQLSGLQQRYNQWQTALAQLELEQAQSGNPLQVAQPAQPATSPTRPNILLYTGVGLLVGLLLGMLLAMLYERVDTRVRTSEDITQLLAPVLATIWRASSPNPKDLINPTGHNINVEAFRMLRTNIGLSSIDKPLHSIIVTSALPHDGKSTIAANLAIFMAKAGKNTLLIDADLRRPTQHTLFNLSPSQLGLSNAVLAFNMSDVSGHQFDMNTSTLQQQNGSTTRNFLLEPFVHMVGIPNMWVMPSGPLPPNPSEFLESKVMQRFLAMIANCGVEVVILDASPLLGLSDASILASKVDGALIVVDTTRARKEKLRQIKAALSQTGVYVLGCVANKRQHKRNENAYYYYTEDQDSRDKSTVNGHVPAVPVTPMLGEHSVEQKYRSN